VAQTEANLASAHANVDAARAAFFPQIGLTGSGGFASAALSNLFTGSGIVWTIGSSLAQTLFGGGTLKGQLELNKARQQELVAAYQSAVLNAFSDVEKALSQVSSLALQERLKTAQEKSAAEAFRISELQYRQGETDLLSVLTTQQTLFTAQDQLVQIKLARLQADVGLFQALGGGWSESPVLATQGLPARRRGKAWPMALTSKERRIILCIGHVKGRSSLAAPGLSRRRRQPGDRRRRTQVGGRDRQPDPDIHSPRLCDQPHPKLVDPQKIPERDSGFRHGSPGIRRRIGPDLDPDRVGGLPDRRIVGLRSQAQRFVEHD
jgi:hypothetical protein